MGVWISQPDSLPVSGIMRVQCGCCTLIDSGLMGVQAACDPGQAQKMLDVLCGAWRAFVSLFLQGCLQGCLQVCKDGGV